MAATHGLDEQAEQIKESLDENVIEPIENSNFYLYIFSYRKLILMLN